MSTFNWFKKKVNKSTSYRPIVEELEKRELLAQLTAVPQGSFTVIENTPITVNVLANDTIPDGATISVVTVSAGTNGNAVVNADYTVTYNPFANVVGSDALSYTITAGSESSTAPLLFNIVPPSAGPTAN
jgi:hypothetical protein